MCMAADSVFHCIGVFAQSVGTDDLAAGEVQVGGLRRILDSERESERNLGFYDLTVHVDLLGAPLANGGDSSIEQKRITGNRLHVGNRAIFRNDYDQLDYSLSVREPRFSWINGIYSIYQQATQVLLLRAEIFELLRPLWCLGAVAAQRISTTRNQERLEPVAQVMA